MTAPIPGPKPYTTDLLENLKVAIMALEHGGPGARDPKAVAGLRLAAEQCADMVGALRRSHRALGPGGGIAGYQAGQPITQHHIDLAAEVAEEARRAILDAGGTP